jgi:hypothetical protein
MFIRKNELEIQAVEISKVLEALGIDKHSQTGREIRGACALELLGERYQTIKQHSKANFAKSVNSGTLKMVMESLQQEGLLSRKGLVELERNTK